MTVGQIFTKIGNFSNKNRQIFMLLNCNCAKFANFEDFKTCLGVVFRIQCIWTAIWTVAFLVYFVFSGRVVMAVAVSGQTVMNHCSSHTRVDNVFHTQFLQGVVVDVVVGSAVVIE